MVNPRPSVNIVSTTDFCTSVHTKTGRPDGSRHEDSDRASVEGRRAMRLGLYGGTFDPIHLGHLILAEQCREACRLDGLRLIVAGSPPHKPGGRTAVGHRLEMVRIAIAGHPAFAASDIEANRPGPHYSVETLEAVGRDHPDDGLFFLIGADSLADLPTWREPERIARLATIVVVNRPGIEEVDPAKLPDFGPDSHPLAWVSIPPIGIASSDLRRRLVGGAEHPLHGAARRRGLYRGPWALPLTPNPGAIPRSWNGPPPGGSGPVAEGRRRDVATLWPLQSLRGTPPDCQNGRNGFVCRNSQGRLHSAVSAKMAGMGSFVEFSKSASFALPRMPD